MKWYGTGLILEVFRERRNMSTSGVSPRRQALYRRGGELGQVLGVVVQAEGVCLRGGDQYPLFYIVSWEREVQEGWAGCFLNRA
jgi:hypothetical protein